MKVSKYDQKYIPLATSFNLRNVDLSKISTLPLLKSDDPWEKFLGILALCSRGDFSELPRLKSLIDEYNHYFFCSACCQLVGCAGSWEITSDFIKKFNLEPPGRLALSILPITLDLSCDLRSIDYLLQLFDVCATDEDFVDVVTSINCLFPAEDPMPYFDDAGGDREEYKKMVRKRCAQIRKRVGTDRPVFFGKAFDVIEIARDLNQNWQKWARSDEGIYPRDKIFESATGIKAARKNVRLFLESENLGYYKHGIRYFFGHPIS